MFFEFKGVGYEVVSVDELVSLLRDAHSARHSVALHLVSDQDVLAKDVIPYHFSADDSSDNFARMNTNPHI